MATRKIKWKNQMAGNIPAEDAYNEIERIRKANGGDLTIKNIIDAARNKNNVLHPQIFDKPIKAAAEEYYKSRAQLTLRMLVIEREDIDPLSGKTKVIEYRHICVVDEIQQHKTHVYSSTEEAMNDPDRRQRLIDAAVKELEAFEKKHADLIELDAVFKVIRIVSAQYGATAKQKPAQPMV